MQLLLWNWLMTSRCQGGLASIFEISSTLKGNTEMVRVLNLQCVAINILIAGAENEAATAHSLLLMWTDCST